MNTSAPARAAKGRGAGIVSSSHLVSPRSVEASEFEFDKARVDVRQFTPVAQAQAVAEEACVPAK